MTTISLPSPAATRLRLRLRLFRRDEKVRQSRWKSSLGLVLTVAAVFLLSEQALRAGQHRGFNVATDNARAAIAIGRARARVRACVRSLVQCASRDDGPRSNQNPKSNYCIAREKQNRNKTPVQSSAAKIRYGRVKGHTRARGHVVPRLDPWFRFSDSRTRGSLALLLLV